MFGWIGAHYGELVIIAMVAFVAVLFSISLHDAIRRGKNRRYD